MAPSAPEKSVGNGTVFQASGTIELPLRSAAPATPPEQSLTGKQEHCARPS